MLNSSYSDNPNYDTNSPLLDRDSKDFEEINNKLGSYINAIRTDIFRRQNTNNTNENNSIVPPVRYIPPKEFSLKNLQKDLTTLKLLYDEELRMMRVEIEELSAVKNKYSLDNFNFEVKLQDFIEKFEEIKKVNQSVVNELTETKNKNNRLEFDMEALKIESEKPIRENKQLRRDLEDILKKIGEKQDIANNEISYRQQVETKYKELAETSIFEKRVKDQEIENYKTQLAVANESIDKLETHLKRIMLSREETADQKSLEIIKLGEQNRQLKEENKDLLEKNESLRFFCKDLEQIVRKLESVRKSFESNKNPQREAESYLGEDYESLKSKFFNNNNEASHHRPQSAKVKSDQGHLIQKPPKRSESKLSEQFLESAHRRSPEIEKQQLAPPPQTYRNLKGRTSSSCSMRSDNMKSNSLINDKITIKDYTTDIFNNLENSTFKRDSMKPSSASFVKNNNSILEASYMGNIKIHEVHKNGDYVRILNTSNTIEEDIGNFTIQQMVSSMPVAVYRFPPSVKLAPGRIISVWCRNDEIEQQPPHTFVWSEQNKWGTGPECTTVLSKPNGQAVSWTTGCHKYGNIDTNDELLSVYSPKRVQTANCSINRKKLVAVFSPTKHPHGQNIHSRTGNRDSNSSKHSMRSTPDPFNKNIFNQTCRQFQPELNNNTNGVKSAMEYRKSESPSDQRCQTTLSIRKPENRLGKYQNSDNEDDDEIKEEIYQENVKYFTRNKFNVQNR